MKKNNVISFLFLAFVLFLLGCGRKTFPTSITIEPDNKTTTPSVEVEPIKKDTQNYQSNTDKYRYHYAKPIFTKPFDLDYKNAFLEIKEMLELPEKMNFKRAVFITENAYLDGTLDYTEFCKHISALAKTAKQISIANKLVYDLEDKSKVEIYAGTFNLMTQGFKYLIDTSIIQYQPYLYDFSDFNGKTDWKQMFVTKLLETHSGNCHSLPFLYKILIQENGEKAHLALAPNHIYIKHQIKKNGWYNTELTSGVFPIDAWLMASGYIKLEAIQNGVYMKSLDEKESISICLIDLALGFQKRFGTRNNEFILDCCNLALYNFPNNINALLLKAEMQKDSFHEIMKQQNTENPSEIFNNPKAKELFDDMTKITSTIHKLGYRKMPDEMYIQWLLSLKEEKEKYQNKNLNFNNPK